jgi:hypothetical protein
MNLSDKNSIQLSAMMQDLEPMIFLDFMQYWLMDLVRLQLGDKVSEIVNLDFEKELCQLKQLTTIDENNALLAYLQKLRTQLLAGIHLNKQLLIENVLIRWSENLKVKDACI